MEQQQQQQQEQQEQQQQQQQQQQQEQEVEQQNDTAGDPPAEDGLAAGQLQLSQGQGSSGSSGAGASAVAGRPAIHLSSAATSCGVLAPAGAGGGGGPGFAWGGGEVQQPQAYAGGQRLTPTEAHALQLLHRLPGKLLDTNIKLLKSGHPNELRFGNAAELKTFLVESTGMVRAAWPRAVTLGSDTLPPMPMVLPH